MAWKFEFFNNLGEKTFKYWQNEIGDDFLRYIPEHFLVPPENFQDPIGSGNWTIYGFEKPIDKLYDNYIWIKGHRINLDEPGAIKFERYHEPIYSPGEQVIKNEYLLRKKEYESLFKTKLDEPEFIQDSELGNNLGEPYLIISEDDPLANLKVIVDAEFIGSKLTQNPYSQNEWGKDAVLAFKGNFSEEERKSIRDKFNDYKNGLRLINEYVLKM